MNMLIICGVPFSHSRTVTSCDALQMVYVVCKEVKIWRIYRTIFFTLHFVPEAIPNVGTKFVMVFQENRGSVNENALRIASPWTQEAIVNVTYEDRVKASVTVSRTSPAWVTIPISMWLLGNGSSKTSTVLVTSSLPVSVVAENVGFHSGDATTLLPVETLSGFSPFLL